MHIAYNNHSWVFNVGWMTSSSHEIGVARRAHHPLAMDMNNNNNNIR
jgi:hypothetical protein